ncbi:unnamed protein product [Orchesella dallaii]|uniref:Uncharacterized protein n=1 Tax=Orchesella dallaii TaxID=48710 RepID=A0ABP1RBA2_9HEXA
MCIMLQCSMLPKAFVSRWRSYLLLVVGYRRRGYATLHPRSRVRQFKIHILSSLKPLVSFNIMLRRQPLITYLILLSIKIQIYSFFPKSKIVFSR